MGEKEARNPSLIGQLSMWATMETSCDGLMTHAVEECIDGFFSLYSYFTLRLILLVFALLYLAITGPLLARRLTTIGSDTNLSAREEAGGKWLPAGGIRRRQREGARWLTGSAISRGMRNTLSRSRSPRVRTYSFMFCFVLYAPSNETLSERG